MKRFLAILFAACLLLSGCSVWMDGSHVTVTEHQKQSSGSQSSALTAENYSQLLSVMKELVESGAENGVINVADFEPNQLESAIEKAAKRVCNQFPLGAYAIDTLNYEIGNGGGKTAISVNITYIHGRSEIRQIQRAGDMDEAWDKIVTVLEACGEGVVLLIEEYEDTDLMQLVADYAQAYPEIVMETPQVVVGVYPETGSERVVELKFTYQTSRDVLRQMQSQVQRVFSSAAYYIDSDSGEIEKFMQLYSFLMGRFDYKFETSITPSYSLLVHGVGDSKAVAAAYAAMCRQAGLDCRIVTGTREGEPWCWNLIRYDDAYYHVDLLKCDEQDSFESLTDAQMQGYVWDYSAYPEF